MNNLIGIHMAVKDNTVLISKKPFVFDGVHSVQINKVITIDLKRTAHEER